MTTIETPTSDESLSSEASKPSRPRPARQYSRRPSTIGAGQIPKTRKAKTRPPTNLRDKLGLLHCALPPYSGPYPVGAIEIEVPVSNPQTFHSNKDTQNGVPLNLETVLMTIFYPAALGTGRGKDPAGYKNWSRPTWLPRPRLKSARGYGRFVGSKAAVPWVFMTTALTKLPAFRNAKLATHWPPSPEKERQRGEDWWQQGPAPEGEPSKPCFPLMIFSHGLGGSRTCYSSICGEFASYGFVVCALEHRDGTGPRTFVNRSKQNEDNDSKKTSQNSSTSSLGSKKPKKHILHDKIDYVFPPENPYDTSPTNEKGVDYNLRSTQLRMRLAEIEEAYKVLSQICNGGGEVIAKNNLRQKGYVGSSSRGTNGVDWNSWKNAFYLDSVTMLGHSFGAAATVEVLRDTARFDFVGHGVIYDIWGAPLNPPGGSRTKINRPILGINSEAFMYWQSNFDTVTSLMEEAEAEHQPAWNLTVRGSVHSSQTDFAILYPHLSALLFKMTADPKRALDLNIGSTLEFLNIVMKSQASVIRLSAKDEGIVNVPVVDEVPTDHRPENKWLAVKLKAPNQFRSRVIPKLERSFRRMRDPQIDPSDEIWMHVATSKEEIEYWEAMKDGAGSKSGFFWD